MRSLAELRQDAATRLPRYGHMFDNWVLGRIRRPVGVKGSPELALPGYVVLMAPEPDSDGLRRILVGGHACPTLVHGDDVEPLAVEGAEDDRVKLLTRLPINEREDVTDFLRDCKAFFGDGFHPDTPGTDYLAYRDEYIVHGRTFNDEEASIYDAFLDRAFDVAGATGPDIYAMSVEIWGD